MGTEEKASRPKSKEYPANTLNQAIEFVCKFKDYPFGKPIAYDVAAKELNISVNNKGFTYLISSARQYGLVSTASGKTLSLLDSARRLVRPTESEQTLRTLKLECFTLPKIYKELVAQYKGQSIPPVETLMNVLITYHGILPKAAKNAAKTFIDTAVDVGVVQNGVLSLDLDTPLTEANATEIDSETGEVEQNALVEMINHEGFDAPLSIPFGEQKKALLYMPLNVEKDDAEYALAMITLMFKRLYGVTKE